LQVENQALHTLARQLVNQPETMLQSLVDMAVDLCNAGTAGVSLLETTPNGEEVFRWNVLAGTLAPYVGGTTPRNFSPCGVCLERGTPQLFSHPEQYFTYFQAANTPIVEGLVLALIADNHALGSIWIMSHNLTRHFDAEDVRVMTSLADFTAAALLLNQRQTQELLAKNAQLEAEVVERKRAEESSRKTEAYFRAIANLVPDLLWCNDAIGDTSWYNQRWLDYTGQTLEEAQGYGWLEVIHPDDHAQLLANFQNTIDERRLLRQEHRIRGTDGNYRWFLVQTHPVLDTDGRITQWFGAAIDIHDQRMALEALRESEQRLRALIENLPGGAAFVVDRDLRYLLAEGEALYTAGFRPEALVGHTIFEVLPPELVPNYEAMYRNALAGESFEYEHNAHDRWYISRGTPLRSPNDEIYAVLAVSYDISDRKQAEAALRESEERTRLLIESATDYSILTTDTEGFINSWSEGAKRLFGWTEEEIIGQHNEILFTPEDSANGAPELELRTAREQGHSPDERFHLCKDGSRFYASGTVSPLYRDRVLHGFVKIARDLTEQQRAQEALRESEERLRQAVGLAHLGICSWNFQTGEMRGNDERFAMWGLDPEQGIITLQQAIEMSHPDDREVWNDIISQIEQRGEFRADYRIIRADDKSVRWISETGRVVEKENGSPLRVSSTLLDMTAHYEAEAAVRESEAKYRSLFNSMDEGFGVAEVIFDEQDNPIDLRWLEVNPQFEHLTGLSRAEVLSGQTIRQVAPDLEERWFQIYGRVAQTGEPVRFEEHSPSLDRWFDVYAFRIGEPQLRRVAVLFNNISDRKRAEEQLRRTAELDAFRVTLSDALRSLCDPIEIQRAAMRVVGERLAVDRVLYTEIANDGETILIADNYVRGNKPKIVGHFPASDFGTASEILRAGQTFATSDINRDENLPDAEREALRALGNISCVAVPLVKKGRWVSNLGVYHGEPRQWTADEIRLLQETAERTWAAVERACAEDALCESEIQRIREQAAREEERQRAEALAELDRAKTVFFSNVSHEFRTPLTLLLAPLQDALSDHVNPLAPSHRERLELAHRNAIRLLKLVNTLLDFSRIEAGRMEAVYEPTDLAMFTAELASVFRSASERAGLRLIVDCPPLPEPVYVEREMWEKIVLNLLSNALKFTLEGEIAVRLHPADDRYVTLQVQDTGTGISPEELPHLFERFYQIRGAKARSHEGSGIGLALVQELIQMHGGTVDVSSVVEQGSCFTITIPLGTAHLPSERLRRGEAERIQATRNLASTPLGAAPYVEEAERWLPEKDFRLPILDFGLGSTDTESGNSNSDEQTKNLKSKIQNPKSKILLVDDNADMRDYLRRILSEHVQVEAVADGAAALAAVQAQVPDLVLSDVMMPGLDGFGLLQALRADPRTREIPIILLSARAGEESVVEGLEAGADDYLIKPFSAQELVSRVNAHLQRLQLRSEALRQERTINSRKDELLSTVSHELNTPLVAILGWTRLLRANPSNQSMLMKSLETIERNAKLQAKLIQDLLDISRITAGKLRLSFQPVELKSVIEMAIAAVLTAAIAKDIHLEWQHSWVQAASGIKILGDRDRLQQVSCNLLTNAIKFTPESGSFTVELAVTEPESASDKSYAQIRVTDTGIGIAAEFLPHVFDRFRQAEGADSAKGLGLGLAIARHLVELHNGTIHAESLGTGQGATFTVKLPVLKE
jgi:PAS domain S-box-containing protein